MRNESGFSGSDIIAISSNPADLDSASTRLLQNGPIARVSLPGSIDTWVISHHHTLRQILADPRFTRDWRHWRALQEGEIPENHPLIGMCRLDNMVTAHGPNHQRLRGVLSKNFTQQRIALMRPCIEQLVTELIDAMKQQGSRVDLMASFAIPLPTNVIAELFGLPAPQRAEIVALTNSLASTVATPEEARATREHIPRFFEQLVETKRLNLRDDLASALILARDDSELTSDTELLDMLFMVLSAGFVTVSGVIGNGVRALLTHPDQLQLLRNGDILWEQAIEEILRWGSSVAYLPFRYAMENMDIGGRHIRRGDSILMAFHAANRDPDEFGPSASQFDITRQKNRHLSFGQGPHFCLGTALARLELMIALPALFTHFTDFTLATADEDIGYMPSYVIRCPSTLPASFSNTSQKIEGIHV
ncbi:cytochrome P450 [Erwinia tracheiphila]|uniref:Cytochrome P450 n=1 Tax=Erwinia tracheiphila TaxID=65700 RepID=A0A345CWZ8_9GAMM|nr:cytochrome P450 [Erwinia tracheiphila]AXF77965.1 cytochrome P450 [Erwinia tracheiphila]UIA83324.1 cytochrome P450 [Erwinia tracheiphila]UIA91926.1 cytochrome P450 [Erwinia tracheiphila]